MLKSIAPQFGNPTGLLGQLVGMVMAYENRERYPDNTFDKAITINSLHHWPDRHAGLHEMKRVLKPEGLIVVVEQPRTAATEVVIRELSSRLKSELAVCGFRQVGDTVKPMKAAATVAAMGRK